MTVLALPVVLAGLLGQASASAPPGPPSVVGGEIQEPRRIAGSPPKYPEEARRAGLAGPVVVECTIDSEGRVADVRILQGVPPLTEAAAEAIRRWRYTPTLVDGAPTPVVMTVTVNFKMENVTLRDLLGSLKSRNEHVREAAARNLGSVKVGGWIGPGDVRDAIGALEPLVQKDESPRVRLAAARSLFRLDGRPLPLPAVDLSPEEPPGGEPLSPADTGPRQVAWGTFVDPLGQCRVEGEAGRIEIEVPAGAFDLSIELGQVTAPRLLQPVEGDLVAQVTVDQLPEPAAAQSQRPRLPYHGAGLLLWQDERTYVRLEAAVMRRGDSAVRYALFEVRRDGRVVGRLAGTGTRLRGGPVALRLERRGRDLRGLVRQAGEAWAEAGRAEVEMPREVSVGIAAVNAAGSALRAGFTGFELLTEPGPTPAFEAAPAPPSPAATDGVSVATDYDSPPKPLHKTRPSYPQLAFIQKIEGTVVVEITIDAAGRVTDARVLQSVPGLDEAALACVRSWTFAPARKGGKAVPAVAHVPVKFRIDR